eukprot:7386457-Prymnesium_polylepis.1
MLAHNIFDCPLPHRLTSTARMLGHSCPERLNACFLCGAPLPPPPAPPTLPSVPATPSASPHSPSDPTSLLLPHALGAAAVLMLLVLLICCRFAPRFCHTGSRAQDPPWLQFQSQRVAGRTGRAVASLAQFNPLSTGRSRLLDGSEDGQTELAADPIAPLVSSPSTGSLRSLNGCSLRSLDGCENGQAALRRHTLAPSSTRPRAAGAPSTCEADSSSRAMHLVKGMVGGALMSIESFNEMRKRANIPLPQHMAELVERQQEQLESAVEWCFRRQLFEDIANGAYRTQRSAVDLRSLLEVAVGSDGEVRLL